MVSKLCGPRRIRSRCRGRFSEPPLYHYIIQVAFYVVLNDLASRLNPIAFRFNRLAWGAVDASRPQGVIASGMENGEIGLWDPAKIVAQAE